MKQLLVLLCFYTLLACQPNSSGTKEDEASPPDMDGTVTIPLAGYGYSWYRLTTN